MTADQTPSRPRRVAVVPAYNEESSVVVVLDRLYGLCDELVVVDDGSTDLTRKLIQSWLPGHDNATMIGFDRNQGMSAAYYAAFGELRRRLAAGELSPDDLVLTVDADGQHELDVLERLERLTIDEHLDALLARRDLSYHGPYKKIGNWVLSTWGTLWAGTRLYDIESGYRIFRLGALAGALDYYRGYRYTETVEVAVILGRQGAKVRNDVLVPVPVSRSRTRLRDAVLDALMIPVAALRVITRRKLRPDQKVPEVSVVVSGQQR